MPKRNILATLRFDGRAFRGWQVQPNAPTVMQTFQDALEAALGVRPDVKGCSRTDAGVHARAYGVSFHVESPIPCGRLPAALNAVLPRAMAVTGCREVPEEFHARYSAKGKRYVYRILNTPVRDPFWEGMALHVARPLDAAVLDKAAKDFIGTHDFSAFRNAGGKEGDAVRTVFDSGVCRSGDLVLFSVSGDGFLYNMVRIMTGTLLDIACGRIGPDAIKGILASKNRLKAGATAPACGLLLDEVFYDLD